MYLDPALPLTWFVALQKVGDTPKQGTTPVKPLSHRERCFVQRQAIFLLRNITKVRRMRQTKPPLTLPLVANRYHAPTQTDGTLGRESFFSKTDVFMTQLTALRNPRSVKTRYAGLRQYGTVKNVFAIFEQILL